MKNLRERIGLKILRLIDRYIDSFEKRIFILCAGHGMSSVGDKPTTGSYRQV